MASSNKPESAGEQPESFKKQLDRVATERRNEEHEPPANPIIDKSKRGPMI